MTSADRPVALVTGGTSGIGAAIARRLAADGMTVTITSRSSHADGKRMAAELDGSYVAGDLADPDVPARLVEAAVVRHGRLDVLVNCAGITRAIAHDDLAAATPDVWHELFNVNLLAPWLLITAALPHLRASTAPAGGCVLNVSSHAGVFARGASVPYAASKAALNHVSLLLAASLGPEVRVNVVAPGLVDTPMTQDWTAAQDEWRSRAPMGRAARPADVADLAASLIANPYVTGQVVVLDGGRNLRA